MDDIRVRADGLSARLEQYRPGDKVLLIVARRDRMMRVEITLGAEPARVWRLEVSPSVTEAQRSVSQVGSAGEEIADLKVRPILPSLVARTFRSAAFPS